MVVDERWPEPARRLLPLVQQLIGTSKSAARQAIHDGLVRVNQYVVRSPHALLRLGDRLEVEFDPARDAPRRVSAPYQPIEIVFEDDALIVVNKPPQLLTVPTPNRERNTALTLLQRRTERAARRDPVICPVHRLDRGVSGLVAFAKGVPVAESLRDQFADRKPDRRYVALVRAVIERPSGTFRSRLVTDPSLHRHSTDDPERGELAITHYTVVERFDDATLVQVVLETGRRNQIRVHFAEAGHAVLGDPRYGGGTASDPKWPYRRIALHAESLGFAHPVTGAPLRFTAPWPPEFVAFVRAARRASERSDAHRPPKRSPPRRHRPG